MGSSPSSLVDENTASLIKGQAQAELQNFAPIYRKQYALAFLSHVHEELVQHKEAHTQLLKQREPPKPEEVLYEDHVLCFDDNRRWKERYTVVRANYSLECYENYDAYVKGSPPLHKLLPAGGTVLTTEEKYKEMVDKCFPDTNNVKEDFAPPVADMPGEFPVYLRLPYCKDNYFCFCQEDQQTSFICVLSDCIRHQDQDFLKTKSYETEAFVKAIQLYRQEKGHYEAWDMLIGSDVQALANLTMEDLLPPLEKDLLPRLKNKKTDRKKIWFATVEATYFLVQETLMVGMTALKDECKEIAKKQSALMRSDMDQIMSSRAFLESKLRATVAEPATKYCMEHVEPHLPAILEELMGPISLGFRQAQELSEAMMEQLCKDYQKGMTKDDVQLAFAEMSKPNLHSCYEKVSGLSDHIQELQQAFSNPNSKGLEQSTQIDIQQLVENVAYTFELLLHKAEEENKNVSDAMVKAKHRVLKQYDYDSSTMRKTIFKEALISITLPSIKAHLAPTFKKELPTFEQYIFADYVSFINVENIYEDILQQLLEVEVNKVVKEAAIMKKYNLFTESRYHYSTSSQLSTPPGSIPGSPTHIGTSPSRCCAKPVSPLLNHNSAGEPAEVGQKAKAVASELDVNTQVEVHVYAYQGQMEHAEILEGIQTCGSYGLEEQVQNMHLSAEKEKNTTTTIPEWHTEHTTNVLETTEAALTATENLKEGENTEVQSATPPVLSTEALVDPPDMFNTESTPQTLEDPFTQTVEPVSSGALIETNCKKEEDTGSLEDTRPLEELLKNEFSYSPGPHSEATVNRPSAEEKSSSIPAEPEVFVYDPADEVGESGPILEAPHSEFASWETEDNEVMENSGETDPRKVAMRVKLKKAPEFLIVKPKAIAESEASTEISAGQANYAHIASDKLLEASGTTDSNPQPTEARPQTTSACPEHLAEAPTEAQPVTRPPDCIKEIRDLLVEVIEVEEIVQRYPDNGGV